MAQENGAPVEAGANATDARDAAKASLLAELQSMEGGGDVAETPADQAQETPADDATTATEGDESDAEPEESAEDDETGEDTEQEEPDEEEKEDPVLAKRLAAIQRAEKRAKEAQQRERQEWQAEVQRREREWEAKLQSARQFEDIAKRAKHDPASVLAALGLTEDDYEAASKQLYALSRSGSADPKLREAAARELRDRRYADELQATRNELAEMRREREQERQQARQQREVEQYLGRVEKAATDATPLVRSMLDKNPERTRQRLVQVAEQLMLETDEVPEPADVIEALEKMRLAELEELGIDPAVVLKKKTTPPKKTTPVAGEKKAAKTLSNDIGSKTSPRKTPATRQELEAEVLRELERGELG